MNRTSQKYHEYEQTCRVCHKKGKRERSRKGFEEIMEKCP